MIVVKDEGFTRFYKNGRPLTFALASYTAVDKIIKTLLGFVQEKIFEMTKLGNLLYTRLNDLNVPNTALNVNCYHYLCISV